MMRYKFMPIALYAVLSCNAGYAAVCTKLSSCSTWAEGGMQIGSDVTACSPNISCYSSPYGVVKKQTCSSCTSPKVLTEHVSSVSGCDTDIRTYYNCECPSECKTTSWSSHSTGYEKKTTCDTSTCSVTTSYRCAVGYYGGSTNGASGCARCPASGGVYGTTASAGSTSITSCYLPSGTSFSDSTGSGTYTGNCYYKN